MKISLIAAMTTERVIGDGGGLPWNLPSDLAWFKQQTLHKPVMMGRKTYQSIGRPLPDRHNIVLSRYPLNEDAGVIWVSSVAAGFAAAGGAKELMVIGGGQLYQQLLPQADRLYLTLIAAHLSGTTHFPDYTAIAWCTRFSAYRPADERNRYACRFVILERA